MEISEAQRSSSSLSQAGSRAVPPRTPSNSRRCHTDTEEVLPSCSPSLVQRLFPVTLWLETSSSREFGLSPSTHTPSLKTVLPGGSQPSEQAERFWVSQIFPGCDHRAKDRCSHAPSTHPMPAQPDPAQRPRQTDRQRNCTHKLPKRVGLQGVSGEQITSSAGSQPQHGGCPRDTFCSNDHLFKWFVLCANELSLSPQALEMTSALRQ